MANRSTNDATTRRDENAEQGSGARSGGSRAGAAGQQAQGGAAGGTADRSERERSVQTGRDVDRQPRRGAVQAQGTGARGTGQGLQRRGGAVSPWEGVSGSPFAMMRRMMEDMDRLFENFGMGSTLGLSPWRGLGDVADYSRAGGVSRGGALWAPPLEVFERGDQLVVRADLPGISKDDINVEIDNGVLTVSGERQQDNEEEREGYYRSERSYGAFSRSIALPEGVNEDECNATFRDGVLEVTLKRANDEQSRRRRVEIK